MRSTLYSIFSINAQPNMQTIVRFLTCVGLITMGILAVCLALFLVYLLQTLFLAIGEVAITFNALDPLIRVLLFGIAICFVGCFMSRRKRSAQHGY